jgi:hypothetical protein
MPLPPRAMPPQQMPPQGSGGPIDDLISAQMMQSAVGNPNAPVPSGKMLGRQQRPATKHVARSSYTTTDQETRTEHSSGYCTRS